MMASMARSYGDRWYGFRDYMVKDVNPWYRMVNVIQYHEPDDSDIQN